MGNLDRLWSYQEADMEVVRHETAMRKDPTRTKLLRLRNFVIEQTGIAQQLEEAGEKRRARVLDIDRNRKTLDERIQNGKARLDANELETLEQVQSAIAQAQGIVDEYRMFERELKKLASEAQTSEASLKDIRLKVAQAKQQYASLKTGYDTEYAKQVVELENLKKKREKSIKETDPALIKRYETVKQQCIPPIARLNGDRCGGCNMSLPAVVLKRVGDDKEIVECENCGRILIGV